MPTLRKGCLKMAVLYNLTPIEAMKILYNDETHGVWNGDFIKNEKRGIVVPGLLREFLENYGYFPINFTEGSVHLDNPDDMYKFNFNYNGNELNLMAVGSYGDNILAADISGDYDPELFLGEKNDNDKVEIKYYVGRTTNILKIMLCNVLLCYEQAKIYTGEENDVLTSNGVDKDKLESKKDYSVRFNENNNFIVSNVKDYAVCYNEDSKTFIISEYSSGDDKLYFVIPTVSESSQKSYSMMTTEELEQLFSNEFYMNSLHCDYVHALALITEIIKRMEEENADDRELAKKYRLAGTCCWSLKNYHDTEYWYEKARPIIERDISSNPDDASRFYITLGNFNYDIKNFEKGDEMYKKSLAILEEYLPDDIIKRADIYKCRAQSKEKYDDYLDEAIDLYSEAIELYKTAPKDSISKYEIARTQQLRGDARRKRKELQRREKEEN